MNKRNHIEELVKKIDHIKQEPIKNWIGKVSKSIKIRKIEKKIQSLEKELNK